ncbi:hypothetical protein [Limnohabitans sp.]
MNHLQTVTARTANEPAEKSGYLTLREIAHLIAQALVSQHQELAMAHRSQVYATDRDEFLDLYANQSVNTNPSINSGKQP